MLAKADKKMLKVEYLLPKEKLRATRRSKDITTKMMADAIGVSREQYEKKEAGKYPFNDYEMVVISNALNEKVMNLFF